MLTLSVQAIRIGVRIISNVIIAHYFLLLFLAFSLQPFSFENVIALVFLRFSLLFLGSVCCSCLVDFPDTRIAGQPIRDCARNSSTLAELRSYCAARLFVIRYLSVSLKGA